jgi:hypothetical protein
MSSTTSTDTVVLRHATADDDAALRDLAALDSTRLGPGPHLLAEVGGHLRAAVSLADGAAIADPFHSTTAEVALLRARAGGRPASRPARRLRRPVRRAHPLAA